MDESGVLREKFTVIFEQLFRGVNPAANAVSEQDFYDDLFLLNVNGSYIKRCIVARSETELFAIKDIFHFLVNLCVRTLNDANPLRVLHALQVLDALLYSLFRKRFPDFGFDILRLIGGQKDRETFFRKFLSSLVAVVHRCKVIISLDRFDPIFYGIQSVSLRVFVSVSVARDHVSGNALVPLVLQSDVFRAALFHSEKTIETDIPLSWRDADGRSSDTLSPKMIEQWIFEVSENILLLFLIDRHLKTEEGYDCLTFSPSTGDDSLLAGSDDDRAVLASLGTCLTSAMQLHIDDLVTDSRAKAGEPVGKVASWLSWFQFFRGRSGLVQTTPFETVLALLAICRSLQIPEVVSTSVNGLRWLPSFVELSERLLTTQVQLRPIVLSPSAERAELAEPSRFDVMVTSRLVLMIFVRLASDDCSTLLFDAVPAGQGVVRSPTVRNMALAVRMLRCCSASLKRTICPALAKARKEDIGSSVWETALPLCATVNRIIHVCASSHKKFGTLRQMDWSDVTTTIVDVLAETTRVILCDVKSETEQKKSLLPLLVCIEAIRSLNALIAFASRIFGESKHHDFLYLAIVKKESVYGTLLEVVQSSYPEMTDIFSFSLYNVKTICQFLRAKGNLAGMKQEDAFGVIRREYGNIQLRNLEELPRGTAFLEESERLRKNLIQFESSLVRNFVAISRARIIERIGVESSPLQGESQEKKP